MLVLDGCFNVGFLLKYVVGPTFVLPGINVDLRNHYDLVPIDNEVSFSVLEVIHDLTKYDNGKLKQEERRNLFDLAVYYLEKRKKNIGTYNEVKENEKIDHLLHLLYIVWLAHFKRRIGYFVFLMLCVSKPHLNLTSNK